MRDGSLTDRSDAVRPPSPALAALFSAYLRWYVPRHFHALRIAHATRLAEAGGPLILYLNHPSWWDPLACMILARRYFRDARNHAPMDAAELARYGFMRRLGLFPVEQGSRRGAVQFLRASLQILNTPNTVLWVTPQGEFTDVRQRPIAFKPGLAGLIKRMPKAVAIPLAIEYSFWNERLPEILVEVGEPLRFEAASSNDEIERHLTDAMAAAQGALAALAVARNPAAFETILSGHAGVGLFYDLWRRAIAFATGKAYRAEHTAGSPPTIAASLPAPSETRTGHDDLEHRGLLRP